MPVIGRTAHWAFEWPTVPVCPMVRGRPDPGLPALSWEVLGKPNSWPSSGMLHLAPDA